MAQRSVIVACLFIGGVICFETLGTTPEFEWWIWPAILVISIYAFIRVLLRRRGA